MVMKRNDIPSARTWEALIDLDDLGIDNTYYKTLCLVAATQANEANAIAEEAGEPPPYPVPDYDDADEIVQAVTTKSPPAWWPKKIERIHLLIRTTPENGVTDSYGPHVLDPNSPDLGLRSFHGIISGLLNACGLPFVGTLELKINRTNKRQVGGLCREVSVGERAGGSGRRGGSDSEDVERMNAYLSGMLEKKDAIIVQMFRDSSSVMHASAQVVQATRGVNMAPLADQGSDSSTLVERLVVEAVKIAGGYFANRGNGQPTARAAATELMQTRIPVQQQGWSQIPTQDSRYLLPDNSQDLAGSPPEIIEIEGDYDGTIIEEEYMVDEPAEEILGIGNDQEYEDGAEGSEEDQDLEDGQEDNPLDGMSPEQLAQLLEQYIDNCPDKAAVRRLGIQLAGKLMG
jgi:hypothetical protein